MHFKVEKIASGESNPILAFGKLSPHFINTHSSLEVTEFKRRKIVMGIFPMQNP
jgi:hypothetical protein